MQILCPKFLGREICGDETAVFLEDSVSRDLGHRISDTWFMKAPTVKSPPPVHAVLEAVSGVRVREAMRPRPSGRVVGAAKSAGAARMHATQAVQPG